MNDNNNPYELDDKDNSSRNENSNDLNEFSSGDVRELRTNSLAGPLIMFVGPKECGKTTVLLSLAKYIKQKLGYKIDVNRTYRSDNAYENSITHFLDQLNDTHYAPTRTSVIDFLAVSAFKGSEMKCQFFEAPGESYFDQADPYSQSFPPYLLQNLANSNINKTLVVFFEEGMLKKSKPSAYSARLSLMLQKLDNKIDDVIIMYNKVDRNPHLFKGNKPNLKSVIKEVKNDPNYADFFNTLKDQRLMTQFVAYSSGDFQRIDSGKEVWTDSPDHYNENLWRAISNSVTPSFFGGKKIL